MTVVRSVPQSVSRGFTLIELMIVVAIIGILAAVAVPKFAEMLRKSKEGSTRGDLNSMRSALNVYIGDNEGQTPMQLSDFCPKYIENIPTAKLGGYHNDSDRILTAPGLNRSDFTTDVGGWKYTTSEGASFWVNCTHTDTKTISFTHW